MRTNSFKEDERMFEDLSKCRYYCKNCGHPVIITNKQCKALCKNCNHYVFKFKREEFKYRLIEESNKQNRQDRLIMI